MTLQDQFAPVSSQCMILDQNELGVCSCKLQILNLKQNPLRQNTSDAPSFLSD